MSNIKVGDIVHVDYPHSEFGYEAKVIKVFNSYDIVRLRDEDGIIHKVHESFILENGIIRRGDIVHIPGALRFPGNGTAEVLLPALPKTSSIHNHENYIIYRLQDKEGRILNLHEDFLEETLEIKSRYIDSLSVKEESRTKTTKKVKKNS